jgi:transketolase
MPDSDFRRELAQQLRVDSVRASAAAGSGHPTSSMSAADLIAVLLDGYLTLDFQRPEDPRNIIDLLQGACLTAVLRHAQSCRCDHR